MTTKFRIISTAIFFTTLFLTAFVYFRSISLTASHIDKMNYSIKRIEKGFISFSEKKKKLGKRDLKQFISEAQKEFDRLAIITVASTDYSKRFISKNDIYLSSSKILETIIEDFTRGQISTTGTDRFLEKDYKTSEIDSGERDTFYIFHLYLKPYRLLVVFPHAFDKEDFTRLALEMLLILIVSTILFTALYIVLVKQGRVENAVNYIDLRYNKRAAAREDSSHGVSSITSDTLASSLLPVFEKISKELMTKEITLYLKGTESTYTKAFQYSGSTFLKIESDHFQTIEVSRDKREELYNSATIIMHEGSRLIVPIVDEGSMLAIINIEGSQSFSGEHINTIEEEMKSTTTDIKNYLTLNNVMLDKDTGLFSTSYYHLRYNELLKIKEQNNTDFSLLYIAMGSHLELTKSQFSSLIKTISPIINQRLRGGDLICLYDNYIAILMPGTDSRRASGISGVILKKLSRMRIHLDEKTGIHLKPIIGKASTDNSSEKNIQNTAILELKKALSTKKQI